MSQFRRKWERFFLRNRDKGIKNLMLYIVIARLAIYMIDLADPSGMLYSLLTFRPTKILQGQVWRLISFVLLPDYSGLGSLLFLAISLFFAYYVGRMLESAIGTLKFNLYYLSSILLLDIVGMVLSVISPASEIYVCGYIMLFLDLSLLLAFAALYSDTTVRVFYIIPVKMKYLAWFELLYQVYYIIRFPFPAKLFALVPLLPFIVFFASDVKNLLPNAWQYRRKRAPKRSKAEKPNPNWAKNYRSKDGQRPYHHKCTVCGRTDADYPDLEFRYCSRCKGYYCYCIDHINNHAHITE